jgi:hypothetical protein
MAAGLVAASMSAQTVNESKTFDITFTLVLMVVLRYKTTVRLVEGPES